MKKKFLAALMAFVMIIAMVSCGKTSGDGSSTNGKNSGLTKSNIKVGVIHIGDPADGSGYSYAHDEGIKAMQKELGLKDNQIIRKLNVLDGDNAGIKAAVEDCIAQKCDVIFGTSYGYMDTMESLAKEHPGVIFSHGTGYKSNDTNFNNYFGRIYQARYLAGIAAGLKSLELGKNDLGYVAAYGTTLAETCSGINAFALGAQSVNPNAVVNVKVLNSWYDPAKETSYAEALVSSGCVVIAQHCDTANPQTAAERGNVFGCGYNSDMTAEAPQAHLTAPIWNWGVYYTKAVNAVLDGNWKSFGNYYEGIKEGFIGISPLSNNCSPNTQNYIDQVKALFNEGSWDVFSGVKISFDEEGKIVKTNAELLKNDGTKILDAGAASVEDAVIQGSMNYYVKGVTGDEK